MYREIIIPKQVNFGNSGEVFGELLNTRLITSTSRAINIAGKDAKVVKKGEIIGKLSDVF